MLYIINILLYTSPRGRTTAVPLQRNELSSSRGPFRSLAPTCSVFLCWNNHPLDNKKLQQRRRKRHPTPGAAEERLKKKNRDTSLPPAVRKPTVLRYCSRRPVLKISASIFNVQKQNRNKPRGVNTRGSSAASPLIRAFRLPTVLKWFDPDTVDHTSTLGEYAVSTSAVFVSMNQSQAEQPGPLRQDDKIRQHKKQTNPVSCNFHQERIVCQPHPSRAVSVQSMNICARRTKKGKSHRRLPRRSRSVSRIKKIADPLVVFELLHHNTNCEHQFRAPTNRASLFEW